MPVILEMLHSLIYSQWFDTPSYPDHNFVGKTIIVTGGNIGLGYEACKHFVRLGAAKVILASRSTLRGESAKAAIESQTGRHGVVEVWELDLSNYVSTQAFATRAQSLSRIDVAILNAAVATENFEMSEGNENSITVNVISTALLALMLLPIMRTSAEKQNSQPVLNIVGSDIHKYTKFPERDAPHIFDALSDKETKTMNERYATSKLLQVFVYRKIAYLTSSSRPFVVVNGLSPGLCKTALTRHAKGSTALFMIVIRTLFGWTPEEGSRNLVYAATLGPESHGRFFANGRLDKNVLGEEVSNAAGHILQERIWDELVVKLEEIKLGVTVGL